MSAFGDKTFHMTVTLTGAAQRLSDSLSPVSGGVGQGSYDFAFQDLEFQPDGANGNPIYFGATNGVTSTDYGFRLEKATTGVPPAPFPLTLRGSAKLSDMWVVGTAGEKLHIFGTTL